MKRFVPRIKKIPGFVAYYGIETKDTIWASVSVFDTADGAREASRHGRARRRPSFKLGRNEAHPTERSGKAKIHLGLVAVTGCDKASPPESRTLIFGCGYAAL